MSALARALDAGDKPLHKSGEVRGATIGSLGFVLGVIAKVLQGDQTTQEAIAALLSDPIIWGSLSLAIGNIWSAIKGRKASGRALVAAGAAQDIAVAASSTAKAAAREVSE